MVSTIQSDFIYLWSDCLGHGLKVSWGLTWFISLGTVPCEHSYSPSRASSVLESIHLLWWEPSWLRPEAAQVLWHHMPTTRIVGGWKGAETPSSGPVRIQLGLWDLPAESDPGCLPSFHTSSVVSQVFRGSLCPAPQTRSHGLLIPAVLGYRLWVRSREIR